jgi:copper chaperone CopZ
MTLIMMFVVSLVLPLHSAPLAGAPLGGALQEEMSSEWREGATLEIEDLGGCAGCAGGIVRKLEKLEGVMAASLDAEKAVIRVVVEPGVWLEMEELRDLVRNVGYTAGRIELRSSGHLEVEGGQVLFFPASLGDGVVVADPADLVIDAPAEETVCVSVEAEHSGDAPVLAAVVACR